MSNESSQLTLPTDKLPDIWNDETRMNVLFAPIRNKSVNSQDWDSKLTFWKKLIFDCCTHSQIYTFTLEDLQRLFNVNGRSPCGLNVIIEEMVKTNEIQVMEQFLQKPSRTWSSWAADMFIKKPLIWSYSKIRSTLLTPNENPSDYVHLGAINAEGKKLITNLPDDLKNSVISLKELIDVMGINSSKVDSFKLLLHNLMCTGQVDIREIKSEHDQETNLNNLLIKFGSSKKLEQISDIEVSMHILEQTEKSLFTDLEKLEKQVLNYVEEAKGHISKGHRQMAKSCLRKKHETDKRVSQKANTLHNVQVLLHKLEDTSTSSEVLDSYKLALSTLKKNFKDNGISEDSVSDTVFELGEILDVHEEIQKTLSQTLTHDDDDLEDELQELINSNDLPPPPESSFPSPHNDSDDELKQRLDKLKLPNVPVDEPSEKEKVSL
ncbi:hypothetical protein FQR65_LT01077 [Abscondita terminalis]|nr:hypothetical protein FQR65_LT01077 [Abscondita terminalis]